MWSQLELLDRLACVSGERQRATSMKSNGEKPSYALDPSIVHDWELKANGIRLEELLAAYAQQQGSDRIELPWLYLEVDRPDMFRLKAGLEATQGLAEGILRCQFMPL